MLLSLLSKKAWDAIKNLGVGDGATVGDVVSGIPKATYDTVLSTIKDIPSDIKEIGTGIKESAIQRGESLSEVLYSDKYSPMHKGVRTLAEATVLGGDILGNIMLGAGKALLPPSAESAISSGVSSLLSPIAKSKLAQNVYAGYSDLPETVKQPLKTVGLVGLGISDFYSRGEVSKLFKQIAKEASKSKIEKTLLSKGLDEQIAKPLSKVLAPTKKVSEVKKVFDIHDTIAKSLAEDLPVFKSSVKNLLKEPETKKIIKSYGYKNLDDFYQGERAKRLIDIGDLGKIGVVEKKFVPKAEEVKLTPLHKEALKYNSADEFIEAQDKVYHGTNKKIESGKLKLSNNKGSKGEKQLKGVYLTKDYDLARFFAKDPIKRIDNGYIHEYFISGNILKGKSLVDIAKKMNIDFSYKKIGDYDKLYSILKDKYDGLNLSSKNEYIIFNPNKLKTESQLRKIWEEAQQFKKSKTEVLPLSQPKTEITPKPQEPTKALVPVRGKNFLLQATEKAKQITKNALLKRMRADLRAERKLAKEARKKENAINYVYKAHGDVGRIIKQLKKGARGRAKMTDKAIEKITLENGVPLKDAVRIKRNKKGELVAVITKKDIEEIKKAYKGKKPPKWERVNILKSIAKGGAQEAKRLYALPRIFLERIGLKEKLYDPIREAERNAASMKARIYDRFKEAGLYKEGGWFTADRFTLSKKERERIGKYYLQRQGKKTGVKFSDLSEKAQKAVRIFDDVIQEFEKDFYRVAHKNNKFPGKVENYAPIMTRDDIKLADEKSIPDFIFQNHPGMFSLKKRLDEVPIEMYETDYAKVMTRWINAMSDFIHVGDVAPEIKYLINSKEFKDIVSEFDWNYINKWLRDITTPRQVTGIEKVSRIARKATAVKALGLNVISVLKQILTQIPLTFIEKAPPKLTSRFAKDFGIDVKKLPSIVERKGNVAVQDMQEGLTRAAVGMLTQFDKYNARISLNRLLDKSYKKYKKKGLPIDEKTRALILKEAQDTLDLWYGGMTKSQMPEAFRGEVGKLLNMFIYPLTSQLNGFFYTVLKETGAKKAKALAEVMASVLAIAYLEQAMSNMSFKWSDEKEMTKDITMSLFGNIPVLSQIAFAVANDQPFSPSPLVNSITNTIKAYNRYRDEKISSEEFYMTLAELFGLPAQIRRTYTGAKLASEGAWYDKKGRLLAPLEEGGVMRALVRGKYGSLAVQDYLRNIGKKKEDRQWFYPQVEFIQNGDWVRRMELLDEIPEDEVKDIVSSWSENMQKDFIRWQIAKENPNLTREQLGALIDKYGLDSKPGIATKKQYESYLEKVNKLHKKPQSNQAALQELYDALETGEITPQQAEEIMNELGL